MDEIRAYCLENGIDMDAEEVPEDVQEEETEEGIHSSMNGYAEAGDQGQKNDTSVEGKIRGIGDIGKNQGARKKLFKPPQLAASSEMRAASTVLSPRKKGTTKQGTRQGESVKQMEGKGASIPSSGIPKA
ncbi:unnamed protein product [Eruca vesicaria subsp. sativa]|uniref:Uncharacterized protein n=1 Tax=Eruca vesicaria subsp. sativa TaxID=29727 RepID=A0ABC8J3V6_ERUVS|nr:unnamed protein product [Eruca vesicaria subsp. sativa]